MGWGGQRVMAYTLLRTLGYFLPIFSARSEQRGWEWKRDKGASFYCPTGTIYPKRDELFRRTGFRSRVKACCASPKHPTLLCHIHHMFSLLLLPTQVHELSASHNAVVQEQLA